MRGDLRLAMPAAAAWLTALVVVGLPEWVPWATAVLWALSAVASIVALLAVRRRDDPFPDGLPPTDTEHKPSAAMALVAVSVAAAALVCTAVAAQNPTRHPAQLPGVGDSAVGSAVLRVTGLPEAAPAPFGSERHRVQVPAELATFASGKVETAARSPVLAFTEVDDPETLRIGAVLTARGTLTAVEPGGSREFLFFGRGAAEVVSPPEWWLDWADQVRSSFRTSVEHLPGDGRKLLTGLAIGDDRQVSDELTEAMTVTGLTHLTAVSGANCAVVVGTAVLVAGALGASRRLRLVGGLVTLALFVVLVTPEPSVLRAATMATIVLVATLFGRPAAGLPPLFLSVVVLLAVDPWLARSAGFALSVLATAGLLLLTRPLATFAERVMPRWLALAVAVPVAAQLACQPVLFLLSPQLTPYTVPANLLAEPAAAAVSVLGLGVCLLGVLAPGLAAVAAWLPWVPSAWIGAVARFFAGLPLAVVPLPDSLLAASVAVLLLGAIVFCIAAARRHRVATRLVAGGCAVAVVVSVGLAAGGVVARDTAIPPGWVIAACDIGQGDAVLLRSADRVALVDVGPDPDPLEECLSRLRIDHIDLLVLTHYDRDHVGGLDAVIGRVSTALVGPPDGAADTHLLDRLEQGGAHLVDGTRGLHGDLGSFHWAVLWPHPHTRLHGNDASVTVLFTGPLSALFLGDLGESAQSSLLTASPLLPTTTSSPPPPNPAGPAAPLVPAESSLTAAGRIVPATFDASSPSPAGIFVPATVDMSPPFALGPLVPAALDASSQNAAGPVLASGLRGSPQGATLAAGLPEHVDVVKVSHHGSADQSDRLYAHISARLGLISVGADNTYGHPTDRLLALLARTGTQPFRTDTMGLITVSVSGPASGRAASPPTLSVWSERSPP
ncbi:ComEC/Rec2 family competence protein [Herbiconiux sp. KACC 21604]|uniref:ComEC/Rec2 family competence protein n=1 Tax=unclassified Herbiconiux TaxID=2618217 RepID=UPI001491C467|nr:ComEC/Rec2 family competence protein [Herbiconiux sp. SALV-R1]QJU53015.1 ComEC/Rec2 family competence protein [Herbiconiux sp. SALV-R1]WPO87948.1 ComEC/Rec2 family competence protein [Herbiconiux sp. KACC 21604]